MKIGIVGTGLVGATAGYALLMRGIGRQLVLVDLNRKRAEAEADDLLHAEPFAHSMQVVAGTYEDLAGSRVVIIAAGVSQRPGETRLALLERNAGVFRSVIPEVLSHAPDAVLLVATNPVDVMTHVAARLAEQAGVPSSRVIGSGTTLDTARLRALLGDHLDVDSQHIHAYVLGEHGDSEVIPWSLISVGGIPIEDYCLMQGLTFDADVRATIDEQVRRAAYHIIDGKGATYYGIGSALARIVRAVLGDQRAILTVCTRLPNVSGVHDVTIALPQRIGGDGILSTLFPPLTPEEDEALRASAQVIREAISALGY